MFSQTPESTLKLIPVCRLRGPDSECSHVLWPGAIIVICRFSVSSSSTGADDLEPDLKDTSEGRLTEWRIVEVT
jgi:hypothetical protein